MIEGDEQGESDMSASSAESVPFEQGLIDQPDIDSSDEEGHRNAKLLK